MELYVEDGCGYCTKVLSAAEELGMTFTLHNIGDRTIADELVARGGKLQVPYLVDTENGLEMYESEDIIEYLRDKQADMAEGNQTVAVA
jgi:glutaredoxin